MNKLALVMGVLMLGTLAVVAFSRSPAVRDAALAPITVPGAAPIEATAAEPTPPSPLDHADLIGPAEAAPAEAPVMSDPAPVFDEAEAKNCEAELKTLGVKYEVMDPIVGENGCGAERPLKVSSVGVELKPAVTTRCGVARALAIWTKDVMIPSAKQHLKATPVSMSTGDSYQCRARRGEGEFKVSEHAKANAVDISGIAFSDHESVQIMDRTASTDTARDFQAAIRGGACPYFTTVLGPGSNAAHADHLHFDLIERKSGYRICE